MLSVRIENTKRRALLGLLSRGLCLLALYLPVLAHSTTVPTVAEIGQRNRMEESLRRDVPRSQAVLPGVSLSHQPASPSGNKARMRFTLKQLIIEGKSTFSHNLVYPYSVLSPLFASYLGKEIALTDLDRIASAITQYYRKQGYILTKAIVPPQRISKTGVVRIQVIEGFISDVTIQGALPRGIYQKLMQFGQALEKARPLHIRLLERYALLANDLPGVEARILLRADKQVAGHTKLTFIVKHRPFTTHSSLNNRGTRYLGPVQFSQQITNPGFLALPNRFQARLLISQAGKEMRFAEVSTRQFFGDQGIESWLTVSLNETRPGFDLTDFHIEGHSRHLLWRIHYPWVRTRRFNIYLGGGLDFYDSTTYIDNVLFSDDQVRSVMCYADLSGTDRWRGRGRIRTALWKGLGFLGAAETGADNLTREQGRPQYMKWVLDMERTQTMGRYSSLMLDMRAQYAFNPLLSANQMAVGGGRFGRAYDPSEIVGDEGIAGKIELRAHLPRPAQGRTVQMYAFYDGGIVWNRDSINQIARTSLTSMGGGVRLYWGPRFFANVELAKPLTLPVSIKGHRHWRGFFQLALNLDSGVTRH